MNEEKIIGKVDYMYVSAVFKNTGKISLSKDIKEAISLNKDEQKFLKENVYHIIFIKATTIYTELKI